MNKKDFILELSKLRPSSTFLSLLGYRNAYGEIANYNILFHIDYEKTLQKSLKILSSINVFSQLENIAKQELIDGYSNSLNKITSETKIVDNYTRFFDEKGNYIKGIKLHTATDTLHLYGLINKKKILQKGIYPVDSRKELTVIKDNLRDQLPISKFRQFKIVPNQVQLITVEKLSLLPPTN